jgi:hypothetical protein
MIVTKITGMRASTRRICLKTSEARLVRQAHVQENGVPRLRDHPVETLGTGGGHLDPVCGGGKRLAHLPRHQGWVVVDEK